MIVLQKKKSQKMEKPNNFIINTISRKGSLHKDTNEDFLLSEERQNLILCAVFDGCSTGKDSHFASALFGKILRNSFFSLDLNRTIDLENLMQELSQLFINKVISIQKELKIPTSELLSTGIFCLLNKQNREAKIIAIGDGFLSQNRQNEIINQNNTPNYLAYHLETIEKKNGFESWYRNEIKHFQFSETKNVTIATDGILSFKNQTNSMEDLIIDPIAYLIIDDFLQGNKSMLSRKLNILKNKYALSNTDDISIIRIDFIE